MLTRNQISQLTITTCACLFGLTPLSSAEPTRRQGKLAAGTEWETAYREIDSGQPGPKILIVGGVHGDEPAGAAAADQICHWEPVRGSIIVIPRANVRALEKRTRLTPDLRAELRNLNRDFSPSADKQPPKGVLATAIWEYVVAQQPDWLLDLHEGFDFTQINGESVGSSIIHTQSPAVGEAARQMQNAVNATIADEKKQFILKGPPIDTSLARAANEHLDIKSMILETTSKAQPISLRVRQHRLMVHRFLVGLNMLESNADVLIDREATSVWQPGVENITVAIYDGPGSSSSTGPRALQTCLTKMPNVTHRTIGPAEVQAGVLSQFDVVIFPGGSGSRQAEALGADGRETVRKFIQEGGGYIGHCAGSYLATSKYTWGLGIIDAETVDREHWKRGTGKVQVELTDRGREILGTSAELVSIYYANGPLLAASNRDDIPDFAPLAFYRSEIATNGAPKGVMVDTPAIVAGSFGSGRVLCFSPHPEYTDGLESFVHKAVHWVAEK